MLKVLFSMKVAVVMLVLFGVLVGAATFIENDYGTQSAKALIYQAKWFELFLFYFIAIVVYNIIIFRSYHKKMAIFIFHLSFLVIGIGALMTRYVGFEGMMPIREGATSSTMFSDTTVLQVYGDNQGKEGSISQVLWLSSFLPNKVSQSFHAGDKSVKVKLLEYFPEVEHILVEDPNGKPYLELMVSNSKEAQTYHLGLGETKEIDGVWFAFGAPLLQDTQGWRFEQTSKGLIFEAPWDVESMKMDDQSKDTLPKDQTHLFDSRILYQSQFGSIVLKKFYKNATQKRVAKSLKPSAISPQWALFEVEVDGKSQEVELPFVQGVSSPWKKLHLNGVDIAISLGSKAIELPFAIKLDKFKLERYPGSNTPSSYASDVVLVDLEENLTMPYEIYMNHVLDYKGYRFFQASYDADERGTILSVNYDPGARMTYIGYFLLTLGMVWALFTRNGRFQTLWRETKKLQGSLILGLMVAIGSTNPACSASPLITPEVQESISGYNSSHMEQFEKLVVQDFQGRMKPVDTMAREVVSKVSGKKKLFGLSATEIFLGMMLQPEIYQELPIIKIGHPQIALDLGLQRDVKYAKFVDFFTPDEGKYKLFDPVAQANQKKPLEKSQYDKELILIDERINVLYRTFMGSLFRIFPIPNDPNNTWVAPLDVMKQLPAEDAKIAELTTANYFNQVGQAIISSEWSKADEALDFLKKFQHLHGSAVIPPKSILAWEIRYNKWDIFSSLVPFYLLLGILILVVAFIDLFRTKRVKSNTIFSILLGAGLT
ncbi:MAG TPA: cytochrome C biogenesis protein, partial [Epsilonproteobacteria bacterium]|nr:cytochrome C biogenesis protein [Campylobacterota bacterium]